MGQDGGLLRSKYGACYFLCVGGWLGWFSVREGERERGGREKERMSAISAIQGMCVWVSIKDSWWRMHLALCHLQFTVNTDRWLQQLPSPIIGSISHF